MEKSYIINEVLADVRECELNDLMTEEEQKKWNILSCRQKIYENHKRELKRDAERWSKAMDSYKKYSCIDFEKLYYISEDNNICFRKNENEMVRLQADLLTNVDMLCKVNEDELIEEEKKIVDCFLKVGYTIGNFCPVWKNPGGYRAADTIWNKLFFTGEYEEFKLKDSVITGLRERIDTEFNQRKKENMLMILPEERNAREVMWKLYFIDFFDKKWNLLRKPENVYKYDKKEWLEYIEEITKLIIQRGYRIITDNKEDVLEGKDARNIEEIFTKVGITNKQIICSKKCS